MLDHGLNLQGSWSKKDQVETAREILKDIKLSYIAFNNPDDEGMKKDKNPQ